MNRITKNFGLLVLSMIASYFTAPFIGTWYNTISPQYGNFVTGINDAIIFSGWLMSLGFFVMLIFGFFGLRENKNWIISILIFPTLLWLSSDLYHIYIPIIFGLIGFALAWLIRKIFVKHPNPPMVVR
jgi:hypothetical protein